MGERLQWVIEGGVWQASYLLDVEDGESEGLLISETVVPGFEYADQEFLSEAGLRSLVQADQARKLEWLVRKCDKVPMTNLIANRERSTGSKKIRVNDSRDYPPSTIVPPRRAEL
ncbi:hypothetical protein FOPG_16401 [Fusarium oxysporum f. sp. conglutinans race 2 54008]|nr:hypothetical protein FOPG_16401 [Fusarium oxysporum f. sp. conglutinans race 2 54008]